MEYDDWEFYSWSFMNMIDGISYYNNYNVSFDYDNDHELVFEEMPAYVTFYILTFMISVPGNLCIMLSVWRNKSLHTFIWYMLAAISLSLVIQNITIPFWIVHVEKVTWPFGLALCKLIPFIDSTAITFTCLSLAAMCILRLLAHSIMKRSFREHPLTITVIVASILAVISVAICIPIATFHYVQSFYSYAFCGPMFPSWLSHVTWITSHFLLTFVVPFLVLWFVNPVMYFLRRKFFSGISTETVSYVRQYNEAHPFNANNHSENGGICLNDCSNMNGSNGHAVLKDDFSLIVGTIDVNTDLKRENKVTFLIFMLALSFTFLIGPLSIFITLHYFDDTMAFNDIIYKASIVMHLLHIFFPASIPLISFACSAPLRQGIVKPMRNAFPRNILYTKV